MARSDARYLTPEAQEVLRTRAVDAVLGGMTQTDAALRFGVSRVSVVGWMKRYREGGRRSLAARKRGRTKGHGRLKGWQAAAIVRTITDRTPDQLKLDFSLWTREAVRDLIEQKYGVRVSLMSVGRWLRRWGFTPQKPVRRAWEQDRKAVEYWIKTEYPRIRRKAKADKAEIHWGDEMGMRSDHQAGRSYSPRGKTPAIPGTGNRFGCSMISTITNRGTLRFSVFQGRFTGPVFIRFLDRLLKSAGRKVYLIVDGHPVHKSAKVKKWLAAHPDEIRLFFLPAYSPDLNPDEMLNNDVKANAVGRRRASTREDLMASVRGYLRSTQKRPDVVQNYFHAESVRYALA